MIAALGAVAAASLAGSAHCAGMCGPLGAVLLPAAGSTRLALHGAWHGGRLLGYAALGTAMGALGSAVDLGGRVIGLQRAAMVLAGAALVLAGGGALLRRAGVALPAMRTPRALRALTGVVLRRTRALPPALRALLLGLSAVLLPCGWLYAFALAAAAAGGALWGALILAAFWAGTVPLLALATEGGARLLGPLRRRVPLAAECAVLALGVLLLVARPALPAAARVAAQVDVTSGQVVAPAAAEMPCCHDDR